MIIMTLLIQTEAFGGGMHKHADSMEKLTFVVWVGSGSDDLQRIMALLNLRALLPALTSYVL